MDTNNKQFQDALQNLTAAFFQFLDVVNPSGANRESQIYYISQCMQNIAAHMATLPDAPSGDRKIVNIPVNNTPSSEPSQVQNVFDAPVTQQQPKIDMSEFPEEPNLGREQPFNTYGAWGFQRLDLIEKHLFRFYINEGSKKGLFDMRDISEIADWEKVFTSLSEIMPKDVVIIEGEVSPKANLTCLEKGIVESEGKGMRQYWRVIKPCRVKVTAQ